MTDDDLRSYLAAHREITKVDLQDTKVTDEGLSLLGECRSLASVRLPPATTNYGMEIVEKMTWIRSLSIAGTDVDDAGLEHIEALADLEYLHLNLSITDDGAAYISRLKKLRSLSLLGSCIGDDGFELMFLSGSLAEITELDLSSAMTDASMARVAQLPHIEKLVLVPSISDAGMECLSASNSIKSLMCSSGMSDKGVSSVARINTITELYLTSKSITCDGLVVALPKLKQLNRVFLPAHIPEKCRSRLAGLLPHCSM